MNKKYLLGLLPALLILTSCNLSSNTKTNVEEPQFVEKADDDDNFENLEFANPLKIINPVEYDSYPSLGIQTKQEADGKISIRFIAAIYLEEEELADTTLTWTRSMYKADGSLLKAEAEFLSDKVYTKVNNGSEVYTIEDYNDQFSTDCTYFASYAIRNIPASYKNAYINVDLAINKAKAKKRILATTVDASTSFYFDDDKTGLFVVDCTNPGDGDIFGTTNGSVKEENGNYLFYDNFFEAQPEGEIPYAYLFVDRVEGEKFITYGYSHVNQNVGCGALKYGNTEFFYNTRENMGDDDYWYDYRYGCSFLVYFDSNKNIIAAPDGEKNMNLKPGAWNNYNNGNVKYALDVEVTLKDKTNGSINTTFTINFAPRSYANTVNFNDIWIPDCDNAIGRFTFKCVDATNSEIVYASASHEYDFYNLYTINYKVDTNEWEMDPIN